jgi:hypothetical protein
VARSVLAILITVKPVFPRFVHAHSQYVRVSTSHLPLPLTLFRVPVEVCIASAFTPLLVCRAAGHQCAKSSAAKEPTNTKRGSTATSNNCTTEEPSKRTGFSH